MWTANDSACIWRASSRCCCSTGPSALARAESTSGLSRLRPHARAPAGELDGAREALDVVRPPVAAAVHEERGRSRHAALVRAHHVLGDAPRVLVLREVLVEALGVDPELLGVAHQRRWLKVLLILEQLVVHLPEDPLRARGLGRLGRELRSRVHVVERQLPPDVPYPAYLVQQL